MPRVSFPPVGVAARIPAEKRNGAPDKTAF